MSELKKLYLDWKEDFLALLTDIRHEFEEDPVPMMLGVTVGFVGFSLILFFAHLVLQTFGLTSY